MQRIRRKAQVEEEDMEVISRGPGQEKGKKEMRHLMTRREISS